MSDSNNSSVQIFDCQGRFLSTFNKKGSPLGISIGSDQFIHVCNRKKNCVSVFKTSGEFVTSFGQFSHPYSIVIGDDGFVYVSNFVLAGNITVF